MTQTRWLTDQEQVAWRAYNWSTQLVFEALDRQLQRDAGIPHAHYIILAMLSEVPDRSMTMSELARVLRYSPSRLSHAVARLEEGGWVRRAGHPDDRRTTLAHLTPEGMRFLEATAPGHVAEVQRILFDGLTPEQVAVLHDISMGLLERLTDAGDWAVARGLSPTGAVGPRP